MLRALIWISVAALSLSMSAAATAGTFEEEFGEKAFASFKAGSWHATAAFFGPDYTYGPQYECRMTAPGVELRQVRSRESSEMSASWTFLRDGPSEMRNFRALAVTIGKRRFEVAQLPWRLSGPPAEDGIVLTFDRMLLVARRGQGEPWMPFVYLTRDMLEAPWFEMEFDYEENDRIQKYKSRISLSGFHDVLKWCSREIMRDRIDEARVRQILGKP